MRRLFDPSMLLKRWDHFWFEPIDLYKVGLFRAVFGFTAFIMYAIRMTSVREFFFNDSLLPASAARDILPEFLLSPLPVLFHSDMLNYWGHVLFVVMLLAFTLGLVGRWGTWILFVLSLSFNQRNFPLIYGADLFAHFWLFYLSFINHTKYFSILNVFRNKRWVSVLPDVSSDIVSSAFVRLIQIQLCLSYAYTGIEKLKGAQWWEGSAVWYVVGMRELVAVDMSVLRHFPTVIAAVSMLTVIFEVYFIFAVANKTLRPYWLLIGLGMHIGIAVFMSLPFFGIIMLAPYILFLDSQKLRELNARFFLYLKAKT
jgi:hypothetical protein